MPTMRSVIDAALSEVYGQAQTIDTTSFLAAPLSGTGLTFTVMNSSGFSRGMVQVDDELMLVSEVDKTTGLVTLRHLSARGVRGTTVAPHATGALVTMAPSVPRHKAVEAVGETIRSSPGLFRVGSTEITKKAAQVAYPLPSEVHEVLHVSWLPSGPAKDWIPLRRWTHDKHNGDIVVGDSVMPGRTIRVSYAAAPIVPGQDDEFSDSGLSERCLDVIRYGAAWRLVSFIEPYNLLARSAEAEAMDRNKQPQGRLRVAQYFYQIYSERLRQEVEHLQSEWPIRQHWAGRW